VLRALNATGRIKDLEASVACFARGNNQAIERARLMADDVSLASEGRNQAESFASIYATTCLRHPTLMSCASSCSPFPPLPPEKAVRFLVRHPGQAWPVPDRHSIHVQTLQNDTIFCAVHGRRMDTKAVKELFIHLVANSDVQARPKVEVMQVTREQRQTESNGVVETIA